MTYKNSNWTRGDLGHDPVPTDAEALKECDADSCDATIQTKEQRLYEAGWIREVKRTGKFTDKAEYYCPKHNDGVPK